MTELQQCHTCRWGWNFDKEDDGLDLPDGVGTCHRNAPTPVNRESNYFPTTYVVAWPMVKGDSGCGEWTTRFT
jgi:hypothetical protein